VSLGKFGKLPLALFPANQLVSVSIPREDDIVFYVPEGLSSHKHLCLAHLKDTPKPVICNPVSQPTKHVPTGSEDIVLCSYLNENNINDEERAI
jgi:hypothetical protein